MKYRFNVGVARIKADLERTAAKLGCKVVLMKGHRGEGMVKLGNKRLVCKKFGRYEDNLRAIGLTLEYQRRISEDYGVELARAAMEVVVSERLRLIAGAVPAP